jgi:Flp pilus assembly protein CpaB
MAKKKSFLDGRKTWFFFAALSAVTTAFVIFSLLSSVAATSTYWVLSEESTAVESRTKITPEMLTRVSVPSSAMPANTVELSEIEAAINTADESDDFYSIVRIQPGDIITTSNVNTLTGLGANVEGGEAKVAASFKVSPSLAAGGNIKSGDLVDIAIIYESDATLSARFFLTNVPVVSATVDLDGRAPDDVGAPVLYVVAVSAEDAAKIAVAAQYSIYVVLSAPDGTPNNATATLTDLMGLLDGSVEGVVPAPIDGIVLEGDEGIVFDGETPTGDEPVDGTEGPIEFTPQD